MWRGRLGGEVGATLAGLGTALHRVTDGQGHWPGWWPPASRVCGGLLAGVPKVRCRAAFKGGMRTKPLLAQAS